MTTSKANGRIRKSPSRIVHRQTIASLTIFENDGAARPEGSKTYELKDTVSAAAAYLAPPVGCESRRTSRDPVGGRGGTERLHDLALAGMKHGQRRPARSIGGPRSLCASLVSSAQ